MTTVTLQADETLLERATAALAERHMTLDAAFERTLMEWARTEEAAGPRAERFAETLGRFAIYETGGPYTRDEMNER